LPDLLLRLCGARTTHDERRVASLREGLLQGDPLADDVAGWVCERDSAARRASFEVALTRGIDTLDAPSPPLVALFRQLDRTPDWLDRDALLLGTETLLRAGRRGTYALGGSSLMSGYLSSGAVKPLAATGALARMARRRIAETAKFVRDVATSGRLERFSDGFVTTVRVRLMHALVRRSLRASPTWRTDDWGVPINQSDMVGTVLEFSTAYIAGLTALGYALSRREREAVMHVWRYIGLVMGTREDLLPASFAEALEITRVMNETETGPDDDSRILARALVEAWSTPGPHDTWPRRVRVALEGRFLTGYTRFLLGGHAADGLGLPRSIWRLAPLAVIPGRLCSEAVIRLSAEQRRRAVRQGRAEIETDLALGLEGRPPTFWAAGAEKKG
jgi:hypothetical protein